jgi:hypothetical protein
MCNLFCLSLSVAASHEAELWGTQVKSCRFTTDHYLSLHSSTEVGSVFVQSACVEVIHTHVFKMFPLLTDLGIHFIADSK